MDDCEWQGAVGRADDLLAKFDMKGCHEMLTAAYENGMRHPQILWRLGRSYYEMAEETTDEKIRKPYLKRGLELCEQSVKEDAMNFASHKWLGILISAQHTSTKEKIANAYIIRDQFLEAVKLNPNDATSLHCMGNWCWSVLQVNWLERKVASLLFAEPPTSSYEECLRYLLASAQVGDTIHNAMLIGDVYHQQGKFEDAKKWYKKAVEMPVSTDVQKRNHEKAFAKYSKC